MRILFTGASSFTGYWFAKELAATGHEVVATMQKLPDRYTEEPRKKRVSALSDLCELRFGIAFGDDRFFDLIKQRSWDLLCHHAADVTNYRDPNFNVLAALERNTRQLP